MAHFVKVTGNEGHHHLTFDIQFVQEFPIHLLNDFSTRVDHLVHFENDVRHNIKRIKII